METLLPVIVAFAAALLLFIAGYLFGARKGERVRTRMREQQLYQVDELTRLRERLALHENEDDNLRRAIQQVLTPLVKRDQLSYELGRLDADSEQRRDLTALLDRMAEKGNFSGVLLTDEQGWPLAVGTATRNQDRLGATASLLLLLADRMGRDGSAPPLALLVHDAANTTTLCRLFQVENQRLLLTVTAPGADLNPAALDPALVRLNRALVSREATADLDVDVAD